MLVSHTSPWDDTRHIKLCENLTVRESEAGVGTVFIGRAHETSCSGARVVVPAAQSSKISSLSMIHTSLEFEAGNWFLRDGLMSPSTGHVMGSRTGTFVNGARVAHKERTELFDGDVVSFGPPDSPVSIQYEYYSPQKPACMNSSDFECSICQNTLVKSHILACGHMYCGMCIAQWLSRGVTCPECRQPAFPACPAKAMDLLIEKTIVPSLPMLERRDRQERKRKAAELAPFSDDRDLTARALKCAKMVHESLMIERYKRPTGFFRKDVEAHRQRSASPDSS